MKPDLSSLPEWSKPWAEHRLAQAPHDISGEQWNGLRDWLTALPTERPKMPAKLHKITMSQALEASALWHKDMARQAERIRADQSSFGGDPSAVEVLADGGQGWRWVRITSPEGLDYEGNAMGHCVGRGGYDTGKTIISLRDKHNMPHCTIEWDDNSRIVKQVQGRNNSSIVEKYHRSVVSFIDGLEPLAVQNAGKFGHVFIEGKLVHWSKLPDGLTAEYLDLEGCTGLTHLPDGLSVNYLNLLGCTGLTHLPERLTAQLIYLVDCTGLTHLPNGLSVKELNISNCTGITNLPDGFTSEYLDIKRCTNIIQIPNRINVQYLDAEDCTGLTHLPNGLSVKILNLSGCTGLTHLPDGLSVETLNLSGCTSLVNLPYDLKSKCIYLKDCTCLTHLPNGLNAERIYLNGCTSLTCLPDRLNVKMLNLLGCTGLTNLPDDLDENCRIIGGDHLIRRSTPRI